MVTHTGTLIVQCMNQTMGSMAITVLRFIGYIYSLEPVKIFWTMILQAFSDGWSKSQNA